MSAIKHHFSVKDYYRMGEAGLFRPEQRVELLEGEIIDMMPIGPFHSGVVDQLCDFFTLCANSRWRVRHQNPLRLDRYSEPQPDIALVRPSPDYYKGRHPTPEDVLLVVEVADTSLDYDEGAKLAAYGKAGIEEYWVLNLQDQSIQIYREPHYTGYASVTVLKPGETASPAAFPDVQVDIAAFVHRPVK